MKNVIQLTLQIPKEYSATKRFSLSLPTVAFRVRQQKGKGINKKSNKSRLKLWGDDTKGSEDSQKFVSNFVGECSLVRSTIDSRKFPV